MTVIALLRYTRVCATASALGLAGCVLSTETVTYDAHRDQRVAADGAADSNGQSDSAVDGDAREREDALSADVEIVTGPDVITALDVISVADGGEGDAREIDAGTDAGTADVRVDVVSADIFLPDSGSIDVFVYDAPRDTGPDATIDVLLTDVSVGPDVSLTCTGTHPLLDGGARFCAASDCYCPLAGTGTSGDICFPLATAAVCCPGRSVVCAGGADAGMCSDGIHPLVDGGARFCAAGQCYCRGQDSCRPVAIAAACCLTGVVCN